MTHEPSGKSLSMDRIRASVRAYGQQKALAMDLGMTESTLSKLLEIQVPHLVQLLDRLGLEVVEKGHVANLRAVLKSVL